MTHPASLTSFHDRTPTPCPPPRSCSASHPREDLRPSSPGVCSDRVVVARKVLLRRQREPVSVLDGHSYLARPSGFPSQANVSRTSSGTPVVCPRAGRPATPLQSFLARVLLLKLIRSEQRGENGNSGKASMRGKEERRSDELCSGPERLQGVGGRLRPSFWFLSTRLSQRRQSHVGRKDLEGFACRALWCVVPHRRPRYIEFCSGGRLRAGRHGVAGEDPRRRADAEPVHPPGWQCRLGQVHAEPGQRGRARHQRVQRRHPDVALRAEQLEPPRRVRRRRWPGPLLPHRAARHPGTGPRDLLRQDHRIRQQRHHWGLHPVAEPLGAGPGRHADVQPQPGDPHRLGACHRRVLDGRRQHPLHHQRH